MATLGKRLRAAREAKGFSLRETAEKAGMSPAFLSRLESDQIVSVKDPAYSVIVPVSEEKLTALADVLGQPLVVLMALAGKMPKELRDGKW
jgi:transcriptional regulator with XRE-family HTH domain